MSFVLPAAANELRTASLIYLPESAFNFDFFGLAIIGTG